MTPLDTTTTAPAAAREAHAADLVPMTMWDAVETVETLRASLARRHMDPQDDDYAAGVAQVAADATVLARISHALATHLLQEEASTALVTPTPDVFVGPDGGLLPAALGIPTDQGYEGLARGYQRAVAAHEIPTGVSFEQADALFVLTDLALTLAAAAVEAWRRAHTRARDAGCTRATQQKDHPAGNDTAGAACAASAPEARP